MIQAVTDAAELARVYEDVLEPSFPATEVVTADEFVAAGEAGDLDVLVSRAEDGALQGAIVDGMAFEGDEVVRMVAEGEAPEGIAAFVAKRRPVFSHARGRRLPMG